MYLTDHRTRDKFLVMRNVFLMFVLALAALGTSGCRKKQECLPVCEKVAADLHCLRPHLCKEECDDLAKRTVCRKELDGFAACFMSKGTADWECDDHGKPAPKGSVCVSERNAVSACLEAAFRANNPPKTL